MNRHLCLLLLVACALFTACDKKSDSAASPAGDPSSSAASKGTIGVSLLTLDNPFFKVIGDHITSEGKKVGYDTIVVSGEKDVARQSNQVKDFIVKKVSAIVLSPCDSKAIGPVIREANEAGIPVLTVDIPYRGGDAKIMTQIATLHFKQAESCLLRVAGFREVIDAYNAKAAGKIEIVTELESGGAKDVGYKAAEDALQAHGDLRGIFAINDPAALGARAALEKAGKETQIVIIGFDGQPEGKQAIKEGKIYADPIQFPDKMGVEIVRAIVAHSKGEEPPAETLIPTSLYRKADGEKDPELK
jgi:ribose transport system substrate-binding protein